MKKYDRVMPRVYNRSRSSLKSTSFVTRHQTSPSSMLGAKPSVSNVNSAVFSDLPVVMNDYKVEPDKMRRPYVVKPRKTIKSLDPALSPPRSVRRSQEFRPKSHLMRSRGSAPCVLGPSDEKWPETHMRQCLSSRSHTKLKELKDEIKAYEEKGKMSRLRGDLFQRCGVLLDEAGHLAEDKAVQVEVDIDKTQKSERFPKNPVLKNKWILATGRYNWFPHKNARICSSHFEDDLIIHKNKVTRLAEGAIPTLNLHPILDELAQKTSTDDDTFLSLVVPPKRMKYVPPLPATSVESTDLSDQNLPELSSTTDVHVKEVIPLPCTSAETSDLGHLHLSEPSSASDINMTPTYDDEPNSEEELQIDLNIIAAGKKRRRSLWHQPEVTPPTTTSTSETNVDEDSDLTFFKSLMPLMKNLPIKNKLRIRNLIQMLIYKELESVEQNKAIDSISNKIICTNDERDTKLEDPSDEDSSEHCSVDVKERDIEMLEFTEEEVLNAIKTENEEQALMN